MYRQPSPLASAEPIIAAPTLIKQLPLPLRGSSLDMSDKERRRLDLDLRSHPEAPNEPTR